MIPESANYWWQDDADVIVNRLSERNDHWSEYSTNPVAESWIRNVIAYYSCLLEPNDWQSSLGFAGEQGELVRMSVPQARSIIRQVVGLTTKEAIVFKGVAETDGADVMNEIRLANSVAEKITTEQNLDKKNELAVEHSCLTGMGFFKVTWRTDKGKPFTSGENGAMIYDGAVEITNPLCQDVTYDVRLQDWDMNDWVQCRTVKNRWDMIAQFPELAEFIRALPRILENHSLRAPKQGLPSDEDMIYVYEVYHRPTPAMPSGRMLMYSDQKTVYYDGVNHYGCIPIIPLIPEPIYGMGYAYPLICSLLPAQEMFDHSLSAIATNHSNLAVQNVACPRNSNVSVQEIQGMNFIMYTQQNAAGGGKPEPLNLLQSAPETYKFADVLSKYMLSVSPLNSTVRGEPPSGVTSGTAIATLTANAYEFLSSLSKANQKALETVITLAVTIEAKFATTPRSVMVTGKSNQAFMREYIGNDLRNIKTFKMQRQNPIMSTLSGRLNTAENLMQHGLVKSTQEYLSILDGAPLSRLTDTETSENDLIESENEAMLEGQETPVLITDNHPMHVYKHKTLLNEPNVRVNGAITKAVLDHIQEHVNQAKGGDPFLMGMANTGKMPEGPPPQSGPPPSGGAPPTGPKLLPAEGTINKANPAKDLLAGGR